MPKWITVVFVFFLSTTLLTAKAITIEDVITNHMQASLKKQGNRATVLMNDYAANGSTASLTGVEVVNGRDCYHITINQLSGNKIHYFVDAKNWYVIRKYIYPEPAQEVIIKNMSAGLSYLLYQ